jgi:hypothetical protein
MVGLLLVAADLVEGQAPAIMAPSPLPTDSASYGATGIVFGVLLQTRLEVPEDASSPSSFFLRKAELGMRARVAPATHLSLEVELTTPESPLRRTYVRLSQIERLHLKLGMEKAPLGLDELLSTARVPFVDRSEVSDRFSAAEEMGAHLESRWDRWTFQLSVTNGGRRLIRDDNDRKDVWGRIVWAPHPDLSIGIAALDGRAGMEEVGRRRYNAELRFGAGDRAVQTEYFRAEDGGVTSNAYYVAGFYDLDPERPGGTRLQPAARYERITRSDDLADEELSLLTVGTSLLFDGHRSKLQINYLWVLEDGGPPGGVRAQYQVAF